MSDETQAVDESDRCPTCAALDESSRRVLIQAAVDVVMSEATGSVLMAASDYLERLFRAASTQEDKLDLARMFGKPR